ncbi:hypothetical protein [Haloferula sp. BvORR071]|uniref:hypothetical protein n=1 Tax=Haloferula sp. BvORR071 TaxID=1396141 RepID=UPI00054F640B|nr:hypothetical protein [Haloferula sp. BvORR071]
MKNLLLILPLIALSLGLSSCCSMFGGKSWTAGYTTETYQRKLCGYDVVREEVVVDAKSGLTEVKETKVPRYKTVTKKVRIKCGDCVRLYCPNEGCCGSDTTAARRMSTIQGGTGSPHVGLIPTMKQITVE